ncbi:MAG: hypothetical protein C9356_18770 [Oleiphilus sp.]|nr:MAG: hypothetical protein C9356_18770 [Oleiphilus sp.]
MRKNLGTVRKENLQYLIDHEYGTQSQLARSLRYEGITQATLSDILRSKRSFHDFEARAFEKYLELPDLWMDKDGWLESGWHFVASFRTLTEEERKLFNELALFIEGKVL